MALTDKNLILNNGKTIPQLGLGLYMISPKEKEREKGVVAIQTALETGYRLIDGAHFYHNYEMIYEGMQRAKVKRKDLFISTKIENWNKDFKVEDTRAQVEEALRELKTDYLDLALVHSPNLNAVKVYKILEEYCRQGKIKSLGVSNFNKPVLKDFLKKVDIKPVVNEIQLSPALNRQDTYDFCTKKNIYIIAWRSLGPRTNAGATYIQYLPPLQAIAKKYQVTVPHVALKWALQKNIIIIPKSINPNRIKANSELDSFHLTDDEMKAIHDLPQIYPYWPFVGAAQLDPVWDLS